MASVPPTAVRRRGRVATHDVETLLDLVGAAAREAVVQGNVAVAARVSMPVFDRVKRDVDMRRGITDPDGDPERTPTADAVQRRFRVIAGEPVAWSVIVEQALRAPGNRTMWLAALGRDDAREDLTDALVCHALRRAAAERQARTLTPSDYTETQSALIAADRARFGDEGVMSYLLPTANQVLAHCGLQWDNALKLAGLELRQPRTGPQPNTHRLRNAGTPGMSTVEVIAFYAALNERWPSYPVLLAFATSCDIRMQDKPAGGMKPLRAAAAALLEAQGIAAPGPPKTMGRGRRLTYRYPADGIPGAPLRDLDARKPQLQANPRATELRRQLAVLSLRMWLLGLPAGDTRVRAHYVTWQKGTGWTSASSLDRYGGFAAIKREATEANASARSAGGPPIADRVVADAEALRSELRALHTAGRARQVKPVAFADALRAVLAGPHLTAQPPKQ